MKKFLVLSLVGLLIVAFGTAYAQEKKEPVLDFKASGFIDAQTEWGRNFTFGQISTDATVDDTNAYLETRARLKFDAVMGKNISGTIYFETDSTRWGETTPVNNDQRNALGVWGGDRGALEIKNVYIDFGVPVIPVPITMRVGLQPLSIRNNLLVYTDGMGVTAGIKIDPVTIAPLWFKALEGADNSADDIDVYGLHGFAKVATFTIGGYGLYYNMNTTALAGYSADAYWLGAYADGKAGPVNLNFDFIYDRVKAEATGLADIKTRGWLTRLKVDFPWEKFNFGFVGMYATGDDFDKTDGRGYVVPPGSESGAIFGESVVFYSYSGNRGVTGISAFVAPATLPANPGMGGTWLGKLYGAFKVTPMYKVTAQVMYIGDTTDNGNSIGNAVKGAALRDDSDIGWEFDLINEIQIYKNLKYSVSGGILIAGDALDFVRAGANKSPDNPWLVTTNLTYTF